MRRSPRLLLPLAVLAFALLATIFTSAGPASAGTSCAYPLCSETANRLPSGAYVKVARDWCGTAERLSQANPPCGASALVDYVASGGHTPSDEDWDAFRVEPGCYVTYDIYSSLTNLMYKGYTSDRRGRGTEWIRVHDDQTAYIRTRSC